MLIDLIEILKYGIIILLILGVIAALLSPFIVLSNQSLIADGLSHVSFLALSIGLIFYDDPFYLGIPIVIMASIIIKWLINNEKIKTDAALGIVSSVSFAIGLILIKFSTSAMNLEQLMTGSLWLRSLSDIYIAFGLLVFTLVFIILNYRKLISLTLDINYARFSGVKVNLLSYIFASLVAVFVVIGIRSLGVLLISSFLIFPLVTASLLSRNFKNTIIYGILITVFVILVGLITGHLLNVSTSSTIVLTYALIFILLSFLKKVGKVK